MAQLLRRPRQRLPLVRWVTVEVSDAVGKMFLKILFLLNIFMCILHPHFNID